MKFFKGSEERLAEDWVYEKVAEEIERNELRKGLWLKASSEALGDDKKARAIYVKLRVRQFVDELELATKIKEERKQQATQEAQARAAQEDARAQAAKRKERLEEVQKPAEQEENTAALVLIALGIFLIFAAVVLNT